MRYSFKIRLLVGCLTVLLWPVLVDAAVAFKEGPYSSVKDLGKRLGMQWKPVKKGKKVRLISQWTELQFEKDVASVILNGHIIYLEYPVKSYKGKLYLSQHDYKHTLSPILTPQLQGKPPKLYRIVLDPGHGGKDPGTANKSHKLQEKKLTLDIAKRLQKLLNEAGYSVLLTRTNDTDLELPDRTDFANKHKADLFVSIHFNAVAQGQHRVNGIETYVLRATNTSKLSGYRNNSWNVLSAYYVQTALQKKLKATDRGLKRANFRVLKNLNSPGMLVELGFVTHPEEAKKIKSADYRQKIAQALYEGILDYQKSLNHTRKMVKKS